MLAERILGESRDPRKRTQNQIRISPAEIIPHSLPYIIIEALVVEEWVHWEVHHPRACPAILGMGMMPTKFREDDNRAQCNPGGHGQHKSILQVTWMRAQPANEEDQRTYLRQSDSD